MRCPKPYADPNALRAREDAEDVVDLMSACLLGGRLDGAAGAPGAPRAGGRGKQARAHAPPLLLLRAGGAPRLALR